MIIYTLEKKLIGNTIHLYSPFSMSCHIHMSILFPLVHHAI